MSNSENSCGLISFRPKSLQRFATSRVFIIVFGLLGTIQAMAFVYFIATINTIEKRFQLPSQTMGIMMSGNEISQILLVLILSYLGGKGNRPVWMAWGVAISALSCFILASPHFVYGPGEAALALTEEYLDVSVLNESSKNSDMFVCKLNREEATCTAASDQHSIITVVLLFLSQFVLGIGTSLYFSVGQTYMDDNTNKTKTPMLLGVTMALRTLGPVCGFLLGSFCLSLYIDPDLTPLIGRRDPRWLGAWWLGWLVLGAAMLIFAFLLGAFPKSLPKKKPHIASMVGNPIYKNPLYKSYAETKEEESSFHDEFASSKIDQVVEERPLKGIRKIKDENSFFKTLKRILMNRILMVNNCIVIFYILGGSGYMTFYNKYTETQFNTSATTSNIGAGVSTLFSLVIGFLLSGFIISRFKPRTSYLLIWNIVIGCIYVGGEFFIMSLDCPDSKMEGQLTEMGRLDPDSSCNAQCSCTSMKYSPVCDTTSNTTYFSACHAGCTNMNFSDAGKKLFTNCSCLIDYTSIVTQGPCPRNCGWNFILFIGSVCLMQMVGCTGRITNVLINYRSVLPQDKSMAQGLSLFLISLFAFIPGPILYGKIIDNACQVWDNTCGEKGNCWLYDKTEFRIYLNLTAAGFSSIATVLDCVLWYLGRKLDIYEDKN